MVASNNETRHLYRCRYCNYGTFSYRGLTIHMAKAHGTFKERLVLWCDQLKRRTQ